MYFSHIEFPLRNDIQIVTNLCREWRIVQSEFEKRKFQALRYGYSISVNDIKNNIQKQFKSIAQAERESFAIFGRKLCHTTISRYIDTNVEYDGFMIYRLNKNGLKGSEINESA